MHIIQLKPFQLDIILSFNDLERLDRDETIGDRYNGQDKLLVHRVYPCDSMVESRQASLKKREYAMLNRETMDIDIYVPHGVLRDARIVASHFSQALFNLQILPWEMGDPWTDAHIRLEYPGSIKIIDINEFYSEMYDQEEVT